MSPSLFSAEGLAGLVFLFFIAVTVAGALIATNAGRVIRAVAGLAMCFLGVAGLYYFLSSPFVALMKILIYVGAVCVTIVFAVMLAEPTLDEQCRKKNVLGGLLSMAVGVLLTWGLASLAYKTTWDRVAVKMGDGSLEAVGKSLLTTYSMVFELISIVLLVAIIGALVLARGGREKS